ncbi:MAG: DUF4097 family beta strand repeat protein [Gemmatimonadaceae bacterium]|nr:DUF4097 family beta strand repeat protein [Gemmatimonadaceae bacterium]
MSVRLMLSVSALVVATTIAPAAGAQESRRDDAFSWSGRIPSGNTIRIHNINGGIEVTRSSGSRVEVTGEKRWRRGDPDDVRIEQKSFGDDVVICALWTPGSTCEERGIRSERNSRNNNRNNDVSVRFVVRVPEGVRVALVTVNGGIEVRDVTTEVEARTVNGSITARSAGGPVRAHTVNGSIDVAMGSLGRADDLEYETVNGAITLELPSNFGAELELSTVNGRVTTDFPITVSGTLSPRKLRGTVGDGRTRVRASTVNGSVTLRRGR